MEHRAKKKPSSRQKTSAKTPAAEVNLKVNNSAPLVPQPHGGALSAGNPGNKGGTGRPPSAIRAQLRASYDARMGFLDDVIDGKVMVKTRIRIPDLLPFVACPNCGESGMKVTSVEHIFEEIEVMTSASTKDRIAAVEHQAKYSLGSLKEISVENVREKLERQVELLRNRFSGEVLNTLVRELREIWNS